MIINTTIEAHAYAGNEIRDYYFNDAPSYAIAGPEAMAPLDCVRNKTIPFEFSSETTLHGFQSIVESFIWGFSSEEKSTGAEFYFMTREHRYTVGLPNSNFEYILKKYLDPQQSGTITVCFMVSHNAGVIDPKNGKLRYEIRSHEEGKHHEPHVHVKDIQSGKEASFRIPDGELLAGTLPSKLEKQARETIIRNPKYYCECWNTKTDGLLIDINYDLGFTV